jgi:GNAT superfamily N-acetyltransferase
MNIEIKQAMPGDEDAIAELNESVQQLHVAHDAKNFKSAEREAVAIWFGGFLRHESARVWVAYVESIPVGYVSVMMQEHAGSPFTNARRWFEIDQIAVHLEYQRKGIGRELIDRVWTAAREQGVLDVELTSWIFNADAHQAFQSLGFEPKSVRFGATRE